MELRHNSVTVKEKIFFLPVQHFETSESILENLICEEFCLVLYKQLGYVSRHVFCAVVRLCASR